MQCVADPKIKTDKLKSLTFNYTQYYCQLLYEDLDNMPYMEVSKLCKCEYQQKVNRVYFEDGSSLQLDRNCLRKFKMYHGNGCPSYQIYYCGIFNDIEDVKNAIKMFNQQLDKCFDRLVIKEK